MWKSNRRITINGGLQSILKDDQKTSELLLKPEAISQEAKR